jgi:hypothetical protein
LFASSSSRFNISVRFRGRFASWFFRSLHASACCGTAAMSALELAFGLHFAHDLDAGLGGFQELDAADCRLAAAALLELRDVGAGREMVQPTAQNDCSAPGIARGGDLVGNRAEQGSGPADCMVGTALSGPKLAPSPRGRRRLLP